MHNTTWDCIHPSEQGEGDKAKAWYEASWCFKWPWYLKTLNYSTTMSPWLSGWAHWLPSEHTSSLHVKPAAAGEQSDNKYKHMIFMKTSWSKQTAPIWYSITSFWFWRWIYVFGKWGHSVHSFLRAKKSDRSISFSLWRPTLLWHHPCNRNICQLLTFSASFLFALISSHLPTGTCKMKSRSASAHLAHSALCVQWCCGSCWRLCSCNCQSHHQWRSWWSDYCRPEESTSYSWNKTREGWGSFLWAHSFFISSQLS